SRQGRLIVGPARLARLSLRQARPELHRQTERSSPYAGSAPSVEACCSAMLRGAEGGSSPSRSAHRHASHSCLFDPCDASRLTERRSLETRHSYVERLWFHHAARSLEYESHRLSESPPV